MIYNWQQKDWTNFKYDLSKLEELQTQYLEKTSFLKGQISTFSEEEKLELMIRQMATEALKTSEIEGEFILRSDIRSSIQNNLGLNPKKVPVHDLRAIGIAKMMGLVRDNYRQPLTETELFNWHNAMLSYRKDIPVGNWRKHADPMQIVSGALGRERIHFIAPPSDQVPEMMKKFIDWFNVDSDLEKSQPIRAAIAHLWFESIHPFEDGNGRIGRAISEKALAQGLGMLPIFSISQAIESDKKSYYKALEEAQQSNEITNWLIYFLNVFLRAVEEAEAEISFTVLKGKFYSKFNSQLNARQQKAIRRMFAAGHEGFEGGMNAKKYIGITGASRATATRDLQLLAQMGAFVQVGSGRSTRYQLNLG